MLEYLAKLKNNPDNQAFVEKVNVGDYINHVNWMIDIWAEVISVHLHPTDSQLSSVRVITYGRGGKHRKLEHIFFKQIQSISKRMPTEGILFERCRYANFYRNVSTHWPVDMYTLPKYAPQYL